MSTPGNAVTVPSCQWHDSMPCQFSQGDHLPQCSEYKGKFYCPMHLPLGATNAPNEQDIQRHIRYSGDLRGVQFPQAAYNFIDLDGEANLSFCTFADGVVLGFRFRGFSIADARAVGALTIKVPDQGHVRLDGLVCQGLLTIQRNAQQIHHDTTCKGWTFRKARFHGGLDISTIHFSSLLTLDECVIGGRVYFEGTVFPQQTTFYGLRVSRSAMDLSNEGSFRAARIKMSELRNRELEGIFYAWEKRCHRAGLGWSSPRLLFSRLISFLYDSATAYGQSYERAAWWFFLVQMLSALGYSVASGRFSLGFGVDSKIWAFTISQVAKPFELLASRTPTSQFFADVVGSSDAAGWWLFFASLHSVVSLSLAALFLLALRWRFRRE